MEGLSGDIFGSQTQTLTREKEKEKVVQDSVQKELEDTIYKLPESTTFVELHDPFEQEIFDDFFKDLEHKKTKYPYVEPQNKNAQTIETKAQATNSKFSKLKKEFDKVNNAATEQKSQTDSINLIDDILDEDNPFRDIDTEDIWIEDDLFDGYDTQAIKIISKEIIDVAKPHRTVDFYCEPIKTITIPDDIETINITDDIDIPSDDGIAIDTHKKVKIITGLNRLRTASNKIKKKYIHQITK